MTREDMIDRAVSRWLNPTYLAWLATAKKADVKSEMTKLLVPSAEDYAMLPVGALCCHLNRIRAEFRRIATGAA